MPPVIRVKQLGKRYKVQHLGVHGAAYGYRTLRDDLVRWVKKPLGWFNPKNPSATHSDFWALKDLDFEIQPGEVVGIIGRNGAGKSTLLKILSRITKPTTGEVGLRGRVGSLLEVGTGFHPELTGRENIYLNGTILGMHRHEINRKFDPIVQFAEIENFLDTPVKRYSSGMYVRLAFAVAAHLEPEILFVDEVLAVGDLAFQRKCLGRMQEVGRSGTTILFVSHNMPAIESLCTRAFLLDHGCLVSQGNVRDIVQEYHRRILDTQKENAINLDDLDCRARPRKIFRSISLLNEAGQATHFIPVGGALRFKIALQADQTIVSPIFTIGIDDAMGQRLISFQNPLTNPIMDRLEGKGILECLVPQLPLAPGEYWVKLGIMSVPDEIDDVERVLRFTVTDGDLFGTGRGIHKGICVAPAHWTFHST